MATKVNINKVKYYKSWLPLMVITKGLKKGSQLLIAWLICQGLSISMKRTIEKFGNEVSYKKLNPEIKLPFLQC